MTKTEENGKTTGEENGKTKNGRALPHHRMVVYARAVELLMAVREARIRDRKLADEALRAAKGACLNIAPGRGANDSVRCSRHPERMNQ